MEDAVCYFCVVVAAEGGTTGEEVAGKSTDAPPVDFGAVFEFAVATDDFGGHVFGGAEEGAAAGVGGGDFGEAKVGEEEVAICVEETVFGLEVPVDDANGGVQVG